jgi:hypothetical protein
VGHVTTCTNICGTSGIIPRRLFCSISIFVIFTISVVDGIMVWIDTIARIHKSCRILSSPWAMPDVEAATMQMSFLWFTHVEAPAIVSMLMDRNVGLIDICS